jgi:hypothetical protein
MNDRTTQASRSALPRHSFTPTRRGRPPATTHRSSCMRPPPAAHGTGPPACGPAPIAHCVPSPRPHRSPASKPGGEEEEKEQQSVLEDESREKKNHGEEFGRQHQIEQGCVREPVKVETMHRWWLQEENRGLMWCAAGVENIWLLFSFLGVGF